MPQKIEVGDRVRLRALDGPRMVVGKLGVDEEGFGWAECWWYGDEGAIFHDVIPVAALSVTGAAAEDEGEDT